MPLKALAAREASGLARATACCHIAAPASTAPHGHYTTLPRLGVIRCVSLY